MFDLAHPFQSVYRFAARALANLELDPILFMAFASENNTPLMPRKRCCGSTPARHSVSRIFDGQLH